MSKKLNPSTPKYQQIATHIAQKIVDGTYAVGDKIYARSSLASHFGVSSETARRAIGILSDQGIVTPTKGSGVEITSYENAISYVKQYKDLEALTQLQKNMFESIQKQQAELERFNGYISDLVDQSEHYRDTNPFIPYQIAVTSTSPYIGKTAGEVNFWQHTTATIIGIKRHSKLILSPGPETTFNDGDLLYFIGDDQALNRVRSFLYPTL